MYAAAARNLAAEIARYGADAFLVTVTPDARPHVGPIHVEVRDDDLVVRVLPGSRTECDIASNSVVCLHWPGTPATRITSPAPTTVAASHRST